MKRTLLGLAATAAMIAGQVTPAFALDIGHYTQATNFCSNYEAGEEYEAFDTSDDTYKVIGRDYKGLALKNFPVQLVGSGANATDGMLGNRDGNVRGWERTYRHAKAANKCEKGFESKL